MRVFLAFPLPAEVLAYIERMQAYLRHRSVRGKWIAPENSHLTVLFLGDQEEPRVQRLADACRRRCAELPPVRFRTGTMTTFGRPARVLVLELADEPVGGFGNTVNAVAECAIGEDLDLPPSALRNEPCPHLTLARFRDGREARTLENVGALRDGAWQWHKPVPPPPAGADAFVCSELLLFKSTLTTDGPVYDELARFPMGPAPPFVES